MFQYLRAKKRIGFTNFFLKILCNEKNEEKNDNKKCIKLWPILSNIIFTIAKIILV